MEVSPRATSKSSPRRIRGMQICFKALLFVPCSFLWILSIHATVTRANDLNVAAPASVARNDILGEGVIPPDIHNNLVVTVGAAAAAPANDHDDSLQHRRLSMFDPKSVQYKDSSKNSQQEGPTKGEVQVMKEEAQAYQTIKDQRDQMESKNRNRIANRAQDSLDEDADAEPNVQINAQKDHANPALFNESNNDRKESRPISNHNKNEEMGRFRPDQNVDRPNYHTNTDNNNQQNNNNNNNEPSHVQLCRELLRRRQVIQQKGHAAAAAEFVPFIVQEHASVCTSSESYAALTHIMTSAMIAQAGSKVRLVYQHYCGKHLATTSGPPSTSTLTIQQLLPIDLTMAVGVGIHAMTEKCQKCLPLVEQGRRHMVECMGYPGPGEPPEPIDPMLGSFRIGGFRHNVQHAIQQYRLLEQQEGMFETAPIVYGGAVILLDLETEIVGAAENTKSWMFPLYYYTDSIPSTGVDSIAIVVTQRCVDATRGLCHEHGMTLAKLLREHYSDKKIQIHGEIVTSTAMAYARIMEAPVLVCPPTLFCALPTLFREYSTQTFMMRKFELYPWFFFLVRENKKLMHKTVELSEEFKIKYLTSATATGGSNNGIVEAISSESKTAKDDMMQFLKRPKPKNANMMNMMSMNAGQRLLLRRRRLLQRVSEEEQARAGYQSLVVSMTKEKEKDMSKPIKQRSIPPAAVQRLVMRRKLARSDKKANRRRQVMAPSKGKQM